MVNPIKSLWAKKQKDATIFESKRIHSFYIKIGLSSLLIFIYSSNKFSYKEAHIEMKIELEIKWCFFFYYKTFVEEDRILFLIIDTAFFRDESTHICGIICSAFKRRTLIFASYTLPIF